MPSSFYSTTSPPQIERKILSCHPSLSPVSSSISLHRFIFPSEAAAAAAALQPELKLASAAHDMMVASEFIRVHVIRWWVLGTAASLLQYSTNWTLVNLLDQYIHIDHCSPAAPAVVLAWLLLQLVYCRVQTHHRWPPCRKMGHPPNPPDEPAGPYLAVCKVLGEILSALVGLAGWPGLHVHGWRPCSSTRKAWKNHAGWIKV